MAAPATITAEQFAHFAEKDKYNVVEIVAFLRATVPQLPDVGVICGSGLSELHTILADRVTIAYKDIPGFPLSTVQGQVGELIFGTLGATNVVLMRGRFHFYEGYEPAKVALPVRVMAALGVRAIVVTNASGGVNPSFNIGDFMVIKDHMSFPGLSGVSPLIGENDARFGPRFPAVGPVYNPQLQQLALSTAESMGMSDRMRVGTYVGVAGPSYETPHEIGAMRVLGGDAVGMSTVPEIVQAAHCGLSILGLALVSNRCKGPLDDYVNPSHEEVLDSVTKASNAMRDLVANIIRGIDVTAFPRTAVFGLFEKFASSVPKKAAAAKCPFSGAVAAAGGASSKDCGTCKKSCRCPVSGKCSEGGSCLCCPFTTSLLTGTIAGAIAGAVVFALLRRK